MRKLYKVTIQLMVVAEDKDSARFAAGGVDLHACDFEAEEITDIHECLPGWENALPFGGHISDGFDDLECAEFIEAL